MLSYVMKWRGVLLAIVVILMTAGCYSSEDDPRPDDSGTDALHDDPATETHDAPSADPPDDDCIPITGYLVEAERSCVHFDMEVIMGCADVPSISMTIASCLIDADTGTIVLKWEVPSELERQGWSMIECPGFSYPFPECE